MNISRDRSSYAGRLAPKKNISGVRRSSVGGSLLGVRETLTDLNWYLGRGRTSTNAPSSETTDDTIKVTFTIFSDILFQLKCSLPGSDDVATA